MIITLTVSKLLVFSFVSIFISLVASIVTHIYAFNYGLPLPAGLKAWFAVKFAKINGPTLFYVFCWWSFGTSIIWFLYVFFSSFGILTK